MGQNTSRQGLTDWYPTWIGVPTTSIGRLVRNRDEAIEEIRKQVKEGVDAVKIAMDGIHRRPNGELVAAFTLDETKAMVDEDPSARKDLHRPCPGPRGDALCSEDRS
jgi:hypothetical protein